MQCILFISANNLKESKSKSTDYAWGVLLSLDFLNYTYRNLRDFLTTQTKRKKPYSHLALSFQLSLMQIHIFSSEKFHTFKLLLKSNEKRKINKYLWLFLM